MSRVHSIKFINFKAIDKFEADFKGCTAIITAGNDKGKTSFLKGLADRIRFVRADVKVKRGEQEGKGEMVLNTGEKFIWEFDVKGKDKLIYIDAQAIKQTVTVELGKRFFPDLFDIDKFLQSTPKEQSKQLQKIVGLDFTDVDTRYLNAYNARTARNLEAEKFHVKLSKMLVVPKVLPVDLTELQAKKEAERTRLNELYKANRESNAGKRKIHEAEKREVDEIIRKHNTESADLVSKYNSLTSAQGILKTLGYKGKEVDKFVEDFKAKIKPRESAAELYPKEPEYIDEMPDDATLQKLDAEILKCSEINTEAKKYSDYIEYKEQTEAAKAEAETANELVISIEQERDALIATANFPKGVTIGTDGIYVDGYPLDKNQISTSKLYTTALRIAAMNLGEVKTLYFDASYLDNNTLSEIESWANEHDLQLLIERPDLDGGEIKYELIEN